MAKKNAPEPERTNTYLKVIITDVMSDYEKYLPSPQAVHLYRRKLVEYTEEVIKRAMKGEYVNGPDTGTDNAGTDSGADTASADTL
jgi:hypothetical protein